MKKPITITKIAISILIQNPQLNDTDFVFELVSDDALSGFNKRFKSWRKSLNSSRIDVKSLPLVVFELAVGGGVGNPFAINSAIKVALSVEETDVAEYSDS